MHKRALDLLRGPYLLAPSNECGGDRNRRAPARESGEHGRDAGDDKRRRPGSEGRAAE